jgi:hypothetical protein
VPDDAKAKALAFDLMQRATLSQLRDDATTSPDLSTRF